MLARPFVALQDADYPAFAQPKLNGVRALATAAGLWSRFGRRFAGLDRIEAALAPVFALEPGLVLDGELYAHALAHDLGATLRALRTGGGPLAFYAFDIVIPETGVEDRADRLEDLFAAAGFADDHPFVRRVATTVVEDGEDLAHHYDHALAAGYEGQIVRREGFYAEGRRAMLKRKPYADAEFEVARIEAPRGPKRPARAVCRSPGGTFTARLAAVPAPDAAPGLATVRFAGRSRAGKPFDASIIAFHGAARAA